MVGEGWDVGKFPGPEKYSMCNRFSSIFGWKDDRFYQFTANKIWQKLLIVSPIFTFSLFASLCSKMSPTFIWESVKRHFPVSRTSMCAYI